MSEREIVINGVRYVPIFDAIANALAIKKGLMEFFYGHITSENIDDLWKDVRVQLDDGFPIRESYTIEEILESISKHMEQDK